MMILGIAIACAMAIFIAGCVSGRNYRTQLNTHPLCIAKRFEDCANDALYVVGNSSLRPPALIGFVEFDDLGHIRNPDLAAGVMSEIGTAASEHPVLLIVFAHGWKHNASALDTNVRDFTKVVVKLSGADERLCAGQPCQGRQVIGVYLGWRGLSNRIEPFNTLTFWRRKAVAQQVGGDGAAQILATLGSIKARSISRADQNVLIVVGHSFGSALIYESLKQGLIRDVGLSIPSGDISRSNADAVILVNPAFEAARFETLRRLSKHLNPTPGQAPLLAIFTSEQDWATKIAFPLGRGLATVFTEYSNDDLYRDERRQDVTAVGHFPRFWTHSLSHQEDPEAKSGGWRIGQNENCRYLLFTQMRSNVLQVGNLVLSRLEVDEPARYETPFWDVRVSNDVIVGHSGIWGGEFSNFLFYLVLQASHENVEGCPSNGLSVLGLDDVPYRNVAGWRALTSQHFIRALLRRDLKDCVCPGVIDLRDTFRG